MIARKVIFILFFSFISLLWSNSQPITFYDYAWITIDGQECFIYDLFAQTADDIETIEIIEIIKNR